jgi:hypothetical protein
VRPPGARLGKTERVTAATPGEKRASYMAGLVRASRWSHSPLRAPIFTSPSSYALSESQYGAMFVPHVIAAIAASLGGAGLASRLGWKRVYLAGLAANLASMALLIASRLVHASPRSTASAVVSVVLGLLSLAVAARAPVPGRAASATGQSPQ